MKKAIYILLWTLCSFIFLASLYQLFSGIYLGHQFIHLNPEAPVTQAQWIILYKIAGGFAESTIMLFSLIFLYTYKKNSKKNKQS